MDSYFYNSNFELDKVIVALNKNFSNFDFLIYDVSYILTEIDIEKVEYIFHTDKIDNNNDVGDILLIYLKKKDRTTVIDAISKLSANPYVIYAEPDYLYNPDVIPNDFNFKYLWGMEKIKAPLAWNYTIGSYNVVVGVLDSGIDYNHVDLKNNMWISPDRQFINGWNFIDDNNNPIDKTGHGTHVAGTIGAVGNNFIGVTGVCWNVQLASFKIGDNRIDLATAIKAIYFANISNIPILNNSWGGRNYSEVLKYVIEQYNALFIASAGNNGADNDFLPIYPASYDSDNIISVAATNRDDTLASFSNYGVNSVDIAAPGVEVLSTDLHDEYSNMNGTSMAAPHVAGAAALLKSYIPELTTLEIKRIILLSSEKNPNLEGRILTGGKLNIYSMIEIANFLTTK